MFIIITDVPVANTQITILSALKFGDILEPKGYATFPENHLSAFQ
jgi:hypothetical protein